VQRNSSGGFSAGIITATQLNGSLQHPLTFGTYLTGSSYDNSSAVTIATNATSANTGSTLVARNSSGGFSAGIITATTLSNANVVQSGNGYLRVNNAYLSSGGDFCHLASHEWYNGSAWQTDGTSGGLYQITGQAHYWYKHNGTGTHTQLMSLDASGNLSVIADITAFSSDMRLKTNINIIENALDKVCNLKGFTYNFNEIAVNYGLPTERQIGVSAQEIKEIIPEAVKSAPFDTDYDDEGNKYSRSGENYLTVQYEKLVPLLIEAIKELREEIKDLKGKK
jgi:hypothetical protein